ncbi:axial budding pattern protein 2 [Diutina catenulata]
MLSWLVLTALAAGQVYVGFPLNEQLPDVARVDHSYSFQMAALTYKSSTANTTVEYSVSEQPAWMQFDPQSRTFSGTPSAGDKGSFTLVLHGHDPSDETTLQNQYTFIVSDKPGLSLSSNFSSEVSNLGKTTGAGSSSLVVSEGEKITFAFPDDAFETKGDGSQLVNTYGRSADRSPLPPWLKFNPDDRTFSGTVPEVTSSTAPSYSYDFVFIGTDIDGYAAAEGPFKLVVGANLLSTNLSHTITINGSLGHDFDEEIPLNFVYLNGDPIDRANISELTAESLPDYAKFDADSAKISGSFPKDHAVHDNFTVFITDKYSNKVQMPFSLYSTSSAFTGPFSGFNATRGEWFTADLGPYLTSKSAKVSVNNMDDWMTWSSENNTIGGMVPQNFDKANVEVAVGDEKQSMDIKGINKKATKSSSTSASSSATMTSSSTSSDEPTAATSSEAPTDNSSHKGLSNKTKLAIGLGVGIPCGILALALLFFLCCRVRRRKTAPGSPEDSDLEKHNDIPSPYGDSFPSPHKRSLSGGFGAAVLAAGAAAAAEHSPDSSPKQLAALSALEFESPKKKHHDDMHSTSSSVTRIESDDSYYDANEKPLKSWRNIEPGDDAEVPLSSYSFGAALGAGALGAAVAGSNARDLNPDSRHSDASMSTVNTDQLFSVRLVDGDVQRDSAASQYPQGVYGLMSRESSGNVQALDSDGEVLSHSNSQSTQGARRMSNLDVLHEEGNRKIPRDPSDLSGSSMYFTGASAGPSQNHSNSSSPDLLEKANRKSLIRTDDVPLHPEEDLDDFTATQTPYGFKWQSAQDQQKFHHQQPSIGTADGFAFSDSPSTLKNSLRNSTLSQLSINTGASQELLNAPNLSQERLARTTSPVKAKLVDFTRKGSLRESTEEQRHHIESSAQIREQDSDSDSRSSRASSNYSR